MLTRFHQPNANSVAAELRRQWESFDALDRPKSLWISCCEQGHDQVVERVRQCAPVLMLRMPGNRLPIDQTARKASIEAIEFTMSRFGISTIVICGHSQCGSLHNSEPVSETCSDPNHSNPATFYSRMVQRVCKRMKALAAAQKNVIDQLDELEGEFCIRTAISAGRMSLIGMFYLAESGIFLRLDELTGEFGPLGQLAPTGESDTSTTVQSEIASLCRTPFTNRFTCSYQPGL